MWSRYFPHTVVHIIAKKLSAMELHYASTEEIDNMSDIYVVLLQTTATIVTRKSNILPAIPRHEHTH